MGSGSTAKSIVDSLAAEHGWDWVVESLMEEVRTAPGEELAAVGSLVDAVLAGLSSGQPLSCAAVLRSDADTRG